MEKTIKPGIYKHFKGKLYKVLSTGKSSENDTEQVIYQSLHDDYNIWVRPLSQWSDIKDGKVRRFEPFSLSSLEYYYDKVALLVIHNRKVLMARSKGKKNFYMPGGKREKGESDVDCLVRECQEELGIHVDPNSAFLYGIYTAFAYVDKPCAQLIMYQAHYQGTPVPSSEIEEIGWLNHADRDKAIGSGRMILDELYWKGMID